MCFFFQAEDGIRDYKVTGVQTCALPISPREPPDAVGVRRLAEGRAHAAPADVRQPLDLVEPAAADDPDRRLACGCGSHYGPPTCCGPPCHHASPPSVRPRPPAVPAPRPGPPP